MISVKGDVKELTRYLTRLEKKQVPFATRVSLKKTADHVAYKTMPKVLPMVFDRPTKWTIKGFYSYQPKGKLLDAYVNMKDGGSSTPLPGGSGRIGTPAFKYLRTQIKGGPRRAKSHELQLRRMNILGPDEFTSPGDDRKGKKMKLNSFGNLTGQMYSKILADVNNTDNSQYDDISRGFGQRTTKRGKKKFFYNPNKKPRGIYMRTGRNKFMLALAFVRQPRYKKRFDFEGIVGKSAKKRFPIEFKRAMERALATAR